MDYCPWLRVIRSKSSFVTSGVILVDSEINDAYMELGDLNNKVIKGK